MTAVSAAVSAARNKATNPRPGTSGSLPGGTLTPAAAAADSNRGAAAAAKAVRALFLQKWKSERHALLFKPLAVEVGAEVHQWDQPGGKAVAPKYRVARVNVGVGELQVGWGGVGRAFKWWWRYGTFGVDSRVWSLVG